LAIEHLGLATLPGCGPRSGCAALAGDPWATVPLTSWPTAFLGTAFFTGMLVLWLGSRRELPGVLRWLTRAGGVASLWLLAVLLSGEHFCVYCLVTHAANLTFWGIVECARARAPLSRPTSAVASATFLAVSLSLWGLELHSRAEARARGEEEFARSTAAAVRSSAEPGEERSDAGFRGRYLLGPERAAVRLVVITDYQCRDCRAIEGQIERLMERHDGVSLSVKHFPYCRDCNPTVERTLHGNACWAARAAETAGILWGDEGFWSMHRWLFEQEGVFTSTEQLESGIRSLGWDPRGFVELMTSDASTAGIAADVQEARRLGLYQTPMIFLNGVELRGWHVPDAVVRAVEAVLDARPEPRTHAGDAPPLAVEKCVADWSDSSNPRRTIPDDPHARPFGASEAALRIVHFGDYLEPTSVEADRIIRSWIEGRSDARYEFRPYPVDRACNPHVAETKHPGACRSARTAEAAHLLGGLEVHRRVHAWLMDHSDAATDNALIRAGAALGVDAEALLALREEDAVSVALGEDVAAGHQLRLRSVPTIFVDGRQVTRWRWLGEERGREILHAILEAACEGR